MPFDWQIIAGEIIRLKNRIEFGLVKLDNDLNEQEKLAAEAYQTAIVKKSREKD